MHIRCPHCHNPIEVVDDASLSDLSCPSCGSQFSLVGGDATKTFRADHRKVGHFELLEQVGVGHFGHVWKVLVASPSGQAERPPTAKKRSIGIPRAVLA